MNWYLIAGVVVASDIELPGVIPAEDGSAAAVTICAGEVPLALEAATAEGPTWQLGKDALLLVMPGVGRFLLRHACEISYQPDEGLPASELAIFLSGPVLALLLELRGDVVLRASGVWVNGKAVLFCGGSGAGKSTLAAAFTQLGYPLLVEDVCAISPGPDPLVLPDAASLKLWATAIGRLGLEDSRGAPVRACLEKHHVALPGAMCSPAPIGAVYNLREARPPLAAGIEAPNVVDAVLAIRRSAYHPLMVQRLGRKGDHFQASAAIARAAGVFHLTRPLSFAVLKQTTAELERHWAQIGLLERAA